MIANEFVAKAIHARRLVLDIGEKR